MEQGYQRTPSPPTKTSPRSGRFCWWDGSEPLEGFTIGIRSAEPVSPGGRGAARSEVTEPSVSAETERALGGEGLVARSVVIDPVLNE